MDAAAERAEEEEEEERPRAPRRVHFGSLEAGARGAKRPRRDDGGHGAGDEDADAEMAANGDEDDEEDGQEAGLRRAQARGNVNISSESSETLELSASALQEQEKRALALLELETQRRARTLVVPTDDGQVKAQLRELGHPICLFGERPADRRDRLRKELALLEVDASERGEIQARLDRASAAAAKQTSAGGLQAEAEAGASDAGATVDAEPRRETFYTTAEPALVSARKEICAFSWARARARLDKEREDTASQDVMLRVDDALLEFEDRLKHMDLEASQVGDRRPLTCCAMARKHPRMVTGSARGWARVWDRDTFEHTWTMADHADRIVDVAIRETEDGPAADDEAFFVATASVDCTAKLWRVPLQGAPQGVKAEPGTAEANDIDTAMRGEDPAAATADSLDQGEMDAAAAADQEELARSLRPTATLLGHVQRLSRVAWHPMGSLVGTSSYDHTWRLWDVESQREILMQDGHDAAVYAFAFHPDGSLVLSGDLKGVARLWDLRSGKAIHSLMGHAGQVLGADFSMNGFHAATGSSDNTARIWDLRMKKSLHTLPGHMSIVRDVRFDPVHGAVLATASYDKGCKLWDASEGVLLADLRAHDKMVTGVAWSPTGEALVTCSYDRTWKLFARSRLL